MPIQLIITLVICGTLLLLALISYLISSNVTKRMERTTTAIAGESGTTVRHVADAAEDALRPMSESIGAIGQALAERIRTKHEELEALRRTCLEQASRIEHLESRRIQIEDIRSTLKLALVEGEFSTHHLLKKETTTKERGFLSSARQKEYLGIFRIDYRQHLGLDFGKLRFQLTRPGLIEVEGLGEAEVIGSKDIRVDRWLVEVREHVLGPDGKPKETRILYGDSDDYRSKEEDEQRKRLLEQINESPVGKALDQAIEKLALAFLATAMKPAGCTVVAASGPLQNPQTFFGICAELNLQLETEMVQARASLAEQEARAHEISGEIQEGLRRDLARMASLLKAPDKV